jgi:hypothetical protein
LKARKAKNLDPEMQTLAAARLVVRSSTHRTISLDRTNRSPPKNTKSPGIMLCRNDNFGCFAVDFPHNEQRGFPLRHWNRVHVFSPESPQKPRVSPFFGSPTPPPFSLEGLTSLLQWIVFTGNHAVKYPYDLRAFRF